MKRKHKLYLKLNLMSLFFIGVSFISVTLAWFAYSGLTSVKTEIGVKAWYVEFTKNDQTVSNDIVLSLNDIYPGMETVNEVVNIKNLGDSDAQLNYSITSVRILNDEYKIGPESTSEYLEDKISHDYPFNININLEKNYVKAKGDSSTFNVSISWPFDSDNDVLDSYWGTEAYKFQTLEKEQYELDSSYQMRTSIKIVISVTAGQYIENTLASDMKYDVGDLILYDIANNRSCTEISETCISTHVIDVNSTLGDSTISLLPDVYSEYLNSTYSNYDATLSSLVSGWNVTTRALRVDDLLNIISNDILNSVLIRENLSNSIIGKLKYSNRIETELQKAIKYNGYYRYNNDKYDYLSSSGCYWTSSNYNDSKAFAFVKESDSYGKIYGESKEMSCSVIPVIVAPKSNI